MANTQFDLAALYKNSLPKDYVDQLAKQYGITADQVYALYANSATNPYMGGSAAGQSDTQGSDTFRMLSLLKTLGGTNGGKQEQQGPTNVGGVSSSSKDLATNMGAQALSEVLGTPVHAIYNPTPEEASSVSGVGKVAKATESDVTPNVISGSGGDGGWQQAGQAAGLSQSDIDQFKAQGLTANDVAQKFGVSTGSGGSGMSVPGIFTKAASVTPTQGGPGGQAVTPAAQATAASVGTSTPFATAPAAPGIQIPQEAHTSALANAGMALYAHCGGDPNTASPEQINNFHTQLTAGIGVMGNAAAPQGGGGPPAAPGGTPEKMKSGGLVPGHGNSDTVPALLTPGEYVIPKQQAAQLFAGRTPIRMESGGFVPDDDPSQPPRRKAPETRRRLITTANQPAQVTQPNQPTQSSQPSSAPAAPGGYTGPTAAQIMAQNAAANNRIGSGGAGSLDRLGTLGDEGIIGSMGIGVGSGAGSGMPTKQAAGVISGLASGLSAAAQAYADSVKPWTVQASHIPDPDSFRLPQTTLGQLA